MLITQDRVMEDRRETMGRYVVWLKDGTVRSSWEPEEKMQKLFNDAGLALESAKIWSQPDTKHITNPPIVEGVEPDQAVPEANNNLHPASRDTSAPLKPIQQEHTPASNTQVVEDNENGKALWVIGGLLLMATAWLLLKRSS